MGWLWWTMVAVHQAVGNLFPFRCLLLMLKGADRVCGRVCELWPCDVDHIATNTYKVSLGVGVSHALTFELKLEMSAGWHAGCAGHIAWPDTAMAYVASELRWWHRVLV